MAKPIASALKADRSKTHKMISVSKSNHAQVQELLLELMSSTRDPKKTMDDVISLMLEEIKKLKQQESV